MFDARGVVVRWVSCGPFGVQATSRAVLFWGGVGGVGLRVEVDPVDSGLCGDVVLRLLSCGNRPDRRDREKYEKTDHFARVREGVEGMYGTCVLCNRSKNLVVHHRHYRSLFREDLVRDVVLLCQRCHGRYHRGHRGRG
jgi:hypothetical protein